MATGVTIASLDWGNRDTNLFIDSAIKNTKIIDMFTVIDGVKSKLSVPIFSGAITFGNNLCVFDPQSTAEIDEKEFSVTNWKWGFQNCKTVLQTTYRSVMLKKGANNEETMDAEFAAWVYDFFAKKSGEKLVELAATEIRAEIAADTTVIKPTEVAHDITTSTILADMQAAYLNLSVDLLNQLYGGADREYKPVFLMNAKNIQKYQIAVANAYTTTFDAMSKGVIMPYLGCEVVLFSTLADKEIMITPLSNLVMAIDDYADVNAIQSEYDAKISSDLLWGQFTVGFSYLDGTKIVYATYKA